MKTVGQMLQAARLARKLDLDDVSRITKIRPQFLTLIEADDYGQLPSGAVARGFIRNYSEFLNLNPMQVLAVFRRDFVENQAGQIVPRGFVEPVNRQVVWTPRTTVVAIVTLILTLFAAYLGYQYHILTGPPALKLNQTAQEITVQESSYEISGSTNAEATLSVNGQLVVLDKGGLFFLRVPLNPGQNVITVKSTSKSGKTSQVTRTVIYSDQ